MDLNSLIVIIQTAVAPCVLISGVGLLILSFTNRIGRPVDRIRLLLDELKETPEEEKPIVEAQVKILYRRAKLLQNAITFAISCIFFTSAIILLLFLSGIYYLVFDFSGIIEFCFGMALVSLIVALVYFLFDVRVYLGSIKLEIDRWIK